VESVLEEIEKEIEKLKEIMVGGYGFEHAKNFIREAIRYCNEDNFEKCLEFIKKAREGVEKERKMISILEGLREETLDASLMKTYEDVVSKIKAGDLDSAERLLNDLIYLIENKDRKRGGISLPLFPEKLLTKYEPIELLSKGSFAMVFKCKRKRDGAVVAVKVPIKNEEAMKAFIREVGRWEELKHENVVEIYDFNVDPYPYIEMELCDGTLRDLEGLSLKDKLKIALKIADALVYAHSKGVVHGDLKPSNILIKHIGRNIVPKLTDWGRGYTPAYAPPEVAIRGMRPDKQADIWSFGVVLYEFLTGYNPFQGKDNIETLKKIAEYEPDFRQLGGDNIETLRSIGRIVEKCLKKNRAERYESMLSVRNDLAELIISTINDSVPTLVGPEKTEAYLEIIETYMTREEYRKGKEKLSDLHQLNILPSPLQQAIERVFDAWVNICAQEELSMGYIEVELKKLFEALPSGCRREFENDEYIGKLWKQIFASHQRSLTETIGRGDEEYDIVKNVMCRRIRDKFSEVVSCYAK